MSKGIIILSATYKRQEKKIQRKEKIKVKGNGGQIFILDRPTGRLEDR